jgi:hypothetical protein
MSVMRNLVCDEIWHTHGLSLLSGWNHWLVVLTGREESSGCLVALCFTLAAAAVAITCCRLLCCLMP